MAGFLLDTNHLSAALNRVSTLRERLLRARQVGQRLGTCVPVLCELEVGIEQTANPEGNRQALSRLLRQIRTWPLDRPASIEYSRIFHELRRAGVVMSQVDMMVAALGRIMGLTVLTTDNDFKAVSGLRTENWLAL